MQKIPDIREGQTFVDEPSIMQFFEYVHLPIALQTVSREFCDLAIGICHLPRSPERTVALRKLLEAKDAAVRAKLYKA